MRKIINIRLRPPYFVEKLVGKMFSFFGEKGKIVGVVHDFNFKSLHANIEPLILRHSNNLRYALINLSTADLKHTLEYIGAAVGRSFPNIRP